MAVNRLNIYHGSRLLLFFTLFMAAVQIVACSDESPALARNKPAPGFSLRNMQEQVVDFPGQFKNQVVIISFWADWCPSCYREMGDFEDLFQRYRDQGLTILAINIKQDKNTARAFIQDLNLSYQLLFDINGEIAKKYAVSSLPVAFIINKAGALDTRVLGETPPQVFEQIVNTLL